MSSRALVCAGQGAQDVGMGKDLADAFPECRALFDRANDVLGYDLARICFEGPIDELTKSSHCQPGIFVMSVACHKALELKVGALDFVATAGLSLGEWTSLHLAGSLSFEDTVRVLEARGRFMQDACEENDGAMVSVMNLDREVLEGVAVKAGVQVANVNSSTQIVLSGERAGIEVAERLCKEAGAKRTVVLNVSGAFHSRLMQSAADRLGGVLADVDFLAPRFPVIANINGLAHQGADSIRAAMVEQVTSSVQWVTSVESLKSEGADAVIEVGPGRILSGLVKRIDRDLGLMNVSDLSSLDATVSSVSG